jgi:hypothetical protein
MLIPISLLGQDMKISLGQILQMIEDGIILPPSLKAQYSADGTAWHTGMKSSDEWIRISDDGGATWGDAMPLRGKDGQEGLRNYTWIKFADDGDGTGMSDSPKGKTWLGIAYNKDTEEESDDPADYKWIPVKGDAGRSVRNVVRYYGVSLKTTIEPKKYVAVPPGKIPVMTAFTPVLWKYETTYFSDGTEESTEPGVVSVRGDKGDSPEVKWIGTKLQVNGLAPVDLKGEKMQFSDLTEDERLSIRGTDGDSAFESWKKLHPGSSSTLSEWLDSLNGKDGKDGENGKDGADGKDGLSAYEIHKKINPLSTLSEADWVASLKGEKFQYSDFTADELESLRGPQGIQGNIGPRGPQGNTGPQGDTGPQGETGPKGEDGATPEIDPDTKEWKIKGKLSGILAQGKDGHSPVVAINSAHHLTVDGVAVGDSLKGADGASITAEWNGKKLVIKNNGTALPEVDLQGAPGVDGKTPEIDPTTKKWKIGDTLTNIRAEGLSAYEVYKKTHTSSSLSEAQWLASLKGDKGDRGEQGLQGIKGDTGDTGAKGDKGDRGLQGLQGLSAYEVYKKNNTASTLTEAQWVSSLKGDKGDRGLKGDKGDKGEQGIQGVKGDTGLSAYELFKRNNASSTLTESQWVSSLKGAKGDKGDQGIQGVKGDKGDTGAKGDKGDKGEQGIQGLRGIQGLSAYDVFKKNNAASTLTEAQWLSSLKGDKGDRGLQGLKGDTGDKGDKGDKGEQGTPGVNGKTWKPTVAADGTLSWAQSDSGTAPSAVNIKGAPGKTFRPRLSGDTMVFESSDDTSPVSMGDIATKSYVKGLDYATKTDISKYATVDMVEKLQLVSDKDGNFKLVQQGGAATTDTAVKVSDFTDKKVFESSISNVNGKFEAYLTKSSAASLFVQKGMLVHDLNLASFTSDGLYYSDTDGNSATLKNSPFAQSFMMLTQTCYNSGDDIRRARLAVDAFGGIKVFDDRSTAGTAGTWHTVMTDKNTKISGGTITINGTSITPLVQHQSLANYVTKNTAQRISGGKTFNSGALMVRQDNACGLVFYSFGDSDTERVAAIELLGASGSWLKNSLDFYKSGRIVARNSFTATSIIRSGGTSSQFLMADGSVATKHTLSSVTNLGWGGTSGQIVTINTLAYWNGQYTAGGSNLMYCDRGRFGTMATMDAADYPTVERFNSGVAFMAGKFPDGGVQFNVMHDEDEPGVGNIVNIPTKTSHLTNDSGFLTGSGADAKYVTALGVAGDWLTWTKNGTTNNITLPYAAESKVLRSQGRLTAVTGNTQHGAGVRLYEAYNNGYPTLGNVLAVQGYTAVGGGELLMGWSGTNEGHASLYYRNRRDTASANWSAWATILDSVNFNSVIGSNLTAYVKKSGDTMTGALNLANNTWNKVGDDASIGDCNISGCVGIKGLNGVPGIQFYKSDGTAAGKMTTDGNLLWNSNKVWHAGNDGPGSGLDADLWDGEQLSNFCMRKVYTLNLGSLSTSNFYPVTFGKSAWEMDCEIHSPSRGGSEAYNQNHIHFILTAQGWMDTVARLLILSQGNFDNGEITIGAIGTGNQNGERCVWLRGGMNYTVIANAVPTLRTADYSDGNEKYTVGTSLYGGTNANVTIRWQNTDTLRDNAKAATLQSNVASATKLQTARTLWGRSFDGTGNVDGAMTVNYSGVISGISLYRKETGSGAFISFYGANQTANYFRIGMAGDGHFSMCYNGGADALSISTGGNVRVGYTNDSYKLATASFICNSWVRTVGGAGWYSETYGGGGCMQDSTWIRIYGGKSLYAASGIIRTDGELQVGGGGDKFRVTAAGAVTAISFTKRGGTAEQALMANGETRAFATLLDDGCIDRSDRLASVLPFIITDDVLTGWNGRVRTRSTDTSSLHSYYSPLAYCNKGAFGDVVTHSHSEYLLAANLLKKTSVGDIGWGTAANQQKPLAMSAIAYWNGAYQGTASNLQYCDRGRFGTIVTKNAGDYVLKSGDTMSGDLTFAAIANGTYPVYSKGIVWSGSTDGASIRYKLEASDLGVLRLDMVDDANTKIAMSWNGTTRYDFLQTALNASGVTATFAAIKKQGGTFTQVLMADGSVKGIWRRGFSPEEGVAIPMGSDKDGSSGEIIDAFDLQLWNGAYLVDATARVIGGDTMEVKSRLAYCKHGAFGDIVTHNASEFLTSGSLSGYATQSWVNSQGFLKSHQSLANYVTKNTAQEISGRKTFSDAIINSYAMSFLFNYRGSTPVANAYGVMFYKRDTHFNILRTKKGAPDTVTFDHGGSLMEIDLATNAVTFAGAVTASNITASSDARLKTRIADISLPIADIAAAPLWRYRRKDTGVVDVGSTAQYWGAILPELTRTDEQGWMSLDYGKTALLASVSLARKADDHEARIKALEAENARLREKIARLEAA